MIWCLKSRIRRCYICCCIVVTVDDIIFCLHVTVDNIIFCLHVTVDDIIFCACHSRRHNIILFKTTHKKVIKSLLAEALFLTCDEFTLILDYVFDVKFNFLWWIEMIICSGWYSINCLLLETGGSNGTVSSSNPHTYWDVLLLLLLRALFLWKECVLCVCFILDINHFWDKQ